VSVETDVGSFDVKYEQLVVALGLFVRVSRSPGWPAMPTASRISPTRSSSANHVLRQLEFADAALDEEQAQKHLSFVFVGAGVRANPLVAELELPVAEKGRIVVDETPRVEGRERVWALGDCARGPNLATPGRFDPPTSQHTLRQGEPRGLRDG
jgi:NADH dehydrogenase FAD-containing subunit